MHDPLVKFQLPEQRPDRVFGLRKTKAFESALDLLESSTQCIEGRLTERSIFRCSPFKDCNDPLLFPFLILEAKPEKTSKGFDDIQIQTAFPIWALLKIQEGLQAKVSEGTLTVGPLVWFIANRGDYWRIYGCYITKGERPQYVSCLLI